MYMKHFFDARYLEELYDRLGVNSKFLTLGAFSPTVKGNLERIDFGVTKHISKNNSVFKIYSSIFCLSKIKIFNSAQCFRSYCFITIILYCSNVQKKCTKKWIEQACIQVLNNPEHENTSSRKSSKASVTIVLFLKQSIAIYICNIHIVFVY